MGIRETEPFGYEICFLLRKKVPVMFWRQILLDFLESLEDLYKRRPLVHIGCPTLISQPERNQEQEKLVLNVVLEVH